MKVSSCLLGKWRIWFTSKKFFKIYYPWAFICICICIFVFWKKAYFEKNSSCCSVSRTVICKHIFWSEHRAVSSHERPGNSSTTETVCCTCSFFKSLCALLMWRFFFLQDVELHAVDSNNKTPLRLAMGRDHKDIVYYLQGKLNRFVSCRLRCVLSASYKLIRITW